MSQHKRTKIPYDAFLKGKLRLAMFSICTYSISWTEQVFCSSSILDFIWFVWTVLLYKFGRNRNGAESNNFVLAETESEAEFITSYSAETEAETENQ